MKILFTICGRAGSKGIKNKNIRMFLDYPLVFYTISVIDLYKKHHSEYEIDTVINSDSDELLRLANENPFFRIDTILREASLGGDIVPKIAVVLDCLLKMQREKQIKYDIVIDLDITSPLRTREDLENLVKVHMNKKPDVTFSVTESRRNPYFNMVVKTEKGVKRALKSNFTTRQQAPEMYDMNASLYAYSPNYLESGRGVLEGYCECIRMYDTGILDLDHESDFELMEVIAKYLFDNKMKFREIYINILEREEKSVV